MNDEVNIKLLTIINNDDFYDLVNTLVVMRTKGLHVGI